MDQRTYRKGDFLTAGTANRAEQAYDLVTQGRSVRSGLVRVTPKRLLPAFSVVALGATSTPFTEPPSLQIADPISDGDGPLYTNANVATEDDTVSEYYFRPIGLIPVKLRVSGIIATGDRAIANDAGQAERGNGSLYCVTEPDSGTAFFVSFPKSTVSVLLFTVKNPSAAGGPTSENTFVYDVFLPDDPTSPILTNVSPIAAPHLHQRHGPGQCKPAKSGSGYQDANGDWVITNCNEVLITGSCENVDDGGGGGGGTDPMGCCTTSEGTFNGTAAECSTAGGSFDATSLCDTGPVAPQ